MPAIATTLRIAAVFLIRASSGAAMVIDREGQGKVNFCLLT
jgi:hypothetical protein